MTGTLFWAVFGCFAPRNFSNTCPTPGKIQEVEHLDLAPEHRCQCSCSRHRRGSPGPWLGWSTFHSNHSNLAPTHPMPTMWIWQVRNVYASRFSTYPLCFFFQPFEKGSFTARKAPYGTLCSKLLWKVHKHLDYSMHFLSCLCDSCGSLFSILICLDTCWTSIVWPCCVVCRLSGGGTLLRIVLATENRNQALWRFVTLPASFRSDPHVPAVWIDNSKTTTMKQRIHPHFTDSQQTAPSFLIKSPLIAVTGRWWKVGEFALALITLVPSLIQLASWPILLF